MSPIFGFTFHIGRMTEVLTPDIYIELTVVTMGYFSNCARESQLKSMRSTSCYINMHMRSFLSLLRAWLLKNKVF